MRSRKAIIAVMMLTLIVSSGVIISLARSSSSAGPAGSYPSTQAIESSSASAATYVAGGGAYGFGAGVTTTVTTTAAETMSTTTLSAPGGPGSTSLIIANQRQEPGASLSPASTGANGSRDIEFFSNLTLRVASAAVAFTQAAAIAYSVGGYVADSAEINGTATILMRVPASSDQDALSQVEALGTLVALASTSNDVTVQYTDLNATLQSLQAEHASLLAILGQSTNINSTLDVESRIQTVDEQINSVQSEILQTRTLVSYATISVVLEQKAVALPLSIRVTATPRSGYSPQSVTFNAVTVGGEQPLIVNYNFGDGSSYQGQALIHTFVQPGRYNVTVTATDSSANVSEAWTVVSVTAPPATSTFGSFPNFISGLFLQVVEGIIEVAVVAVPVATVVLAILFPLRHRLGASGRRPSNGEGSGHAGKDGSA